MTSKQYSEVVAGAHCSSFMFNSSFDDASGNTAIHVQYGYRYVPQRRPAMADDVVDYSGTSESDSESDKVPRASTGRIPAPARACILRMALASFTGMQNADSDAHHRRKRIRSPSVTRFPGTLPRASGGSSASSSDQDAGKPVVQPTVQPYVQHRPP
jgi:hypothetical protein